MPALNDADLELLSAYLDNELSFGERAELERRLRAEPDLRAELDDLQRVAALVRLSAVRAPRDFRLDPAVYGRQGGVPGLSRRAYMYRLASAASALAAGLLLVIGLALLRQPFVAQPQAALLLESQAGPETAIALAPTSTPQPTQMPEAAADETPARAAPTATPALFQANAAAPPATATLSGLPTLIWQKTGTPTGDMAFEAAAPADEMPGQDAPEMVAPPGQPMPSFGAADQGMGAAENTLSPAPFAADVPAPAVGLSATPVGSPEGQEQAMTAALPSPSPSPLLAQGALGMPLTATLPRLQSTSTQTLLYAATASPAPDLAVLPTVAAALPQHEEDRQPETAAPSPVRAVEPGMLVGGAVILLALAAVFWALSRRSA